MPRYTVTVTEIETRVYTFDAPDYAAAAEQAEAWADEKTGSCPDGCIDYDYSYNSVTTGVQNTQ